MTRTRQNQQNCSIRALRNWIVAPDMFENCLSQPFNKTGDEVPEKQKPARLLACHRRTGSTQFRERFEGEPAESLDTPVHPISFVSN